MLRKYVLNRRVLLLAVLLVLFIVIGIFITSPSRECQCIRSTIGRKLCSSFWCSVIFSPVVHTLDGPVQGFKAYSRNDTPFWQYLSIPYAEPPVDTLRFQPPLPAKPWTIKKSALNYSPGCPNFEPLALATTWGQEDCLYLNIFAPTVIPEGGKGYPVLVYFYGGGFVQGQSSFYRPDYLMDKPLIVVTLNYRLGPLGFLNLENTKARGNMGLKDQRLALVWVQRNIERFGGDPRRVTVLGDSAGAASIGFHILSPSSRDLFSGAILFSGFAYCDWAFTRNATSLAHNYAARLGCEAKDAKQLMQCYQKMDAEELIKRQEWMADVLLYPKDNFGPSLEQNATDDVFLTTPPKNLASHPHVRLLAGISSGDGVIRSGRFRAMPEQIPRLEQNWAQGLSRYLLRDTNFSVAEAQKLRQFYGLSDYSEENNERWMESITKLATDYMFAVPLYQTANAHRDSGSPTYLFYYDYRPSALLASYSLYSQTRLDDGWLSRYTKLVGGLIWDWVVEYILGQEGAHRWGVGHGECGLQIWNVLGLSDVSTCLDIRFSEDLVGLIANFTEGTEPLLWRGTTWPSLNKSSERMPFVKLDNREKGEVLEDPFHKAVKFWNNNPS